MQDYIEKGELKIAKVLYNFVEKEGLPGSGLDGAQFWKDFENLVFSLAPLNRKLLTRRIELENTIDQWHRKHKADDLELYKSFLKEIGYLEPEVADFEIKTKNIDNEISIQAGPQLVVPVDNARFALNAANARWGSLYDALYGTDVIGCIDDLGKKNYNPVRGKKVIEYAKSFLDQSIPLSNGSHDSVKAYRINNGQLEITLINDTPSSLKLPEQLVGYLGLPEEPDSILFKNNGLHIELQFDREHPIGKSDKAGLKDIQMESAITTIMDCEDSVAAVDAEDKVQVYRNWLGLMRGNLTATFIKNDKPITRRLNPDRNYINIRGKKFTLRGRSLMFIRNVGHLMTSDAIICQDEEIPEGILDAVITSLLAKHELLGHGKYKNSIKGSIYIVKPKMHGSEEVAFSNLLFNQVEDMLELKRNTIKIGVMDEERRTSLNLKNCIHQVKNRIVFINTGFLDRTGDEIHTVMQAGVMIRKNEMKSSTWLQSYEKSNVAVGLMCGFQGLAQIGKGMWAMPDLMGKMLAQKVAHLKAGANTAWVPSPTAATLHALHYHQFDVLAIQNKIAIKSADYTDDILNIPVVNKPNWSSEEIQNELDNNAQSILGYVVRWIDHGIGCSKVPDINNIGLMEDRATLRISSQHMANWLNHGICTKQQVLDTLKRMAKVVDEQNNDEPGYSPMAADFNNSIAFQAACDLIFLGNDQPNGYTEPILHQRRRNAKKKVTV